MVFLDNLYEVYEKNMDKMTAYHTKFIEKIKYIIIHFLFENPTEVIDINKLATELQSLNGLIEKFDSVENEVVDENKVDYLLSLTKIENADVKEIGGSLDKMNGSNKRKRYNKGKNKTKRLRK
jgi:hypothetical protein